MKLTIEIHTQECYYGQLREHFHKCVNEAFRIAETNAATCTFISKTINGESKFVIKTDEECRKAMVKCNVCEHPADTTAE